MSKESKQIKNELEKQAKINEALEKIEKERAAGNPVTTDTDNDNIKAAKEKLNDAYKRLTDIDDRKKQRQKVKAPANFTYTKEEKDRILQNAKNVTARYMKLKEFSERYEEIKERHETEQIMRRIKARAQEYEQAQESEAEELLKTDEDKNN